MCASAAATASASTDGNGEYFEVGGVYREVVPNERLVFSWAWHSTPERELQVTVSHQAGRRRHAADLAPRAVLRRGRARRSREAAGTNCSASWNSVDLDAEHREPPMQPHKVVSREEWIAARKAHWRMRRSSPRPATASNEERRALPWVKVDKDYVFDGPGRQGGAGRTVRGPQPARGAAFHVRAGLGCRLQELLVLGRRL